ncbi:unnamed protein product [Rhizophagus irregularis]|nr:unnamed protein product [Rhizophagus irregularis]
MDHTAGASLLATSRKLLRRKNITFHGVKAEELKLWKVEIPGDHVDPTSNLSLQDNDELQEHIHVLVEPPVSTATSSHEQEFEQVASLQALLNKSTHDVDVVVHPKRKQNKWTANIEHATLEGLKDYIHLREILRIFVSNKNLKFTVFIETPSKPFSDWSFPKVCQLYSVSNDPNSDIDVFPPFSCGSADPNNDKSKAVIEHLMAEIKLRQDVTPLNKANERVEMGKETLIMR